MVASYGGTKVPPFQNTCLFRASLKQNIPLLQVSDPDVAEADGLALVAMRLQLDRCGVVLFVGWLADVECLAFQLEVILDEDAVEEDGDVGGGFYRAVGVEGGCGPGYVVGLPLAGLAIWVGERDGLFVNAAGLTVYVGLVVVVVEDLELVSSVPGAGG